MESVPAEAPLSALINSVIVPATVLNPVMVSNVDETAVHVTTEPAELVKPELT